MYLRKGEDDKKTESLQSVTWLLLCNAVASSKVLCYHHISRPNTIQTVPSIFWQSLHRLAFKQKKVTLTAGTVVVQVSHVSGSPCLIKYILPRVHIMVETVSMASFTVPSQSCKNSLKCRFSSRYSSPFWWYLNTNVKTIIMYQRTCKTMKLHKVWNNFSWNLCVESIKN